MRTNLPVTNNEYVLQDGKSIVSKTDLKGRITYVNPYFLEVSGFNAQELIGSPQNIVRHPDMPEQAFGDMWKTLKAGLPWNGLVKNRCKNGDYYWVQANVTPVREKGKPVGYMSVRTRPDSAQVKAAEDIYKKIRQNKARGIKIWQGQIVRSGLLGQLQSIRNLSLTKRLSFMMLAIATFIAAMGIYTTYIIDDTTHTTYIYIATALGVMFTLIAWRLLHNNIITPLKEAIHIVHGLAGGDLNLSVHIHPHGDMGILLKALNQLNVNLNSAIGDVRENVTSISKSIEEIANGNMDLSGRTESQASTLEETASSMEEFSATVKKNADNAIEANTQAQSASAIAKKGGEVVNRVASTMQEIHTASNKIVDIIALIDGISFQTNILALNAAVEAARAGEQGRGFAVVASEVRTLAQRSAAAAKDIKLLIDDTVSKVETGNKLMREAGETMGDIQQAILGVTGTMNDISVASREQSAGVEQVNISINLIDQTTQQNAALVEEAAAAAASLKDQTVFLSQAIAVFNLQK